MQQGDLGAPIRMTLTDGAARFALADGDVVELWIRQPSGRVLSRTFEITDPTAGEVYYETAEGDLAEHGRYRFQARALLASGSRVAFSPVDADVGRNVFPVAVYVMPAPARCYLGVPEAVSS